MGTKKADVTEDSKVFNHVGLLENWRPNDEQPFLGSSDDLNYFSQNKLLSGDNSIFTSPTE
jgi:hypothetical protein